MPARRSFPGTPTEGAGEHRRRPSGRPRRREARPRHRVSHFVDDFDPEPAALAPLRSGHWSRTSLVPAARTPRAICTAVPRISPSSRIRIRIALGARTLGARPSIVAEGRRMGRLHRPSLPGRHLLLRGIGGRRRSRPARRRPPGCRTWPMISRRPMAWALADAGQAPRAPRGRLEVGAHLPVARAGPLNLAAVGGHRLAATAVAAAEPPRLSRRAFGSSLAATSATATSKR